MSTDTVIEMRGRKTFLRRGGAGENLLFLHGAQGQNSWLPALAALSQNFDVLAPDHPGFGRSGGPDGIDDVVDLAFFYMDLLDFLELEQVHLVGQSIGGWIALEIAIRSTARVKTLTLASSAGIRIAEEPPADMFIIPTEELAELLFAGKLGQKWREDWEKSSESQEIYMKNLVAAARYSWHPRLFDPRLAKWLHRVKCPTHVLWGDEDRIIPPAYAAAFRDSIPGAKVTILPDCGHLLHIEQPAQFARQVASFIEGAAS